MDELLLAQLKEFKKFLEAFKAKDEEIEAIYDRGEEPSKKDTREFAAMRKEYVLFREFFRAYDGEYFGNRLSLVEVADRIVNEFYPGYQIF